MLSWVHCQSCRCRRVAVKRFAYTESLKTTGLVLRVLVGVNAARPCPSAVATPLPQKGNIRGVAAATSEATLARASSRQAAPHAAAVCCWRLRLCTQHREDIKEASPFAGPHKVAEVRSHVVYAMESERGVRRSCTFGYFMLCGGASDGHRKMREMARSSCTLYIDSRIYEISSSNQLLVISRYRFDARIPTLHFFEVAVRIEPLDSGFY